MKAHNVLGKFGSSLAFFSLFRSLVGDARTKFPSFIENGFSVLFFLFSYSPFVGLFSGERKWECFVFVRHRRRFREFNNNVIRIIFGSSRRGGAGVRVAFPYFVSFSFHLVMNYMYFVLPLGFCSHTIFLCGIQFYYCRAIKIKIIMEILSPSTEPSRVERWHLSAVWADMMSLSHTVAQTIRYPNFKAELFYYSFNYFYEIFHSSDCFDCSVLSQNWKLCAQMQSWNLICERNLFLSSVAKAHGRFGNLFILKYLISTILPFNLYDCF